MSRLALACGKARRLFTRQTLIIAFAICLVWFIGIQFRRDISEQWTELGNQLPDLPNLKTSPPPKRIPTHNVLPPLAERQLCHGPRGHLLGKSPDDDLVERELDGRMQQSAPLRLDLGSC
jgi:biotin synthase